MTFSVLYMYTLVRNRRLDRFAPLPILLYLYFCWGVIFWMVVQGHSVNSSLVDNAASSRQR